MRAGCIGAMLEDYVEIGYVDKAVIVDVAEKIFAAGGALNFIFQHDREINIVHGSVAIEVAIRESIDGFILLDAPGDREIFG